jgi:hypothetical protein
MPPIVLVLVLFCFLNKVSHYAQARPGSNPSIYTCDMAGVTGMHHQVWLIEMVSCELFAQASFKTQSSPSLSPSG